MSVSVSVSVYLSVQVLVEARAWSRTAILNRPSVLNALSTAVVCALILPYPYTKSLCCVWYLILIQYLKMRLSYFKWFEYTFFLCVCFWLWGRHPMLKPWNSGCYLISNWISWKNYYLGICCSNVWLTTIMYNSV